MIYPNFIKEQSVIGVTAPSDGITDSVDLKRLEFAIKNFQERGFQIKETPNVRMGEKGRSSNSITQAREFESLFLDESVKSIICACGGDFLLEMTSLVDYDIIKKNPKWLQGYSDPTGLLYVITTKLDIATIYGNNFGAFGMQPWHKSFLDNLEILKGNLILQTSYDKYAKTRTELVKGNEPYILDEKVKWENLKGEKSLNFHGRIIGGCIDILTELFGTTLDNTLNFLEKYKEDGIIWYFDNYELSSEGLIRTLWKFKEKGWFQYTKGIIFGRSAMEKSSYDISFKESILHSLGDLNIPIIINADIGHVSPRMTIINGAIAHITCENNKGSIAFELK